MQEQFKMLKILRVLIGSAPAKRIAAEREMFLLECCLPLVDYPTQSFYGTLNTSVLCGGESHMVFVTSTDLLRQFRHIAKRR